MSPTSNMYQSQTVRQVTNNNKKLFDMSRNLMVLFLLVAMICVTAMSNPFLKQCKPLPPSLPSPPSPPKPSLPLPKPSLPSPKPSLPLPKPSLPPPKPSSLPLPSPKHCKSTSPPPTSPSPPPPKCPKNEIYKTCGTACQPSCKNPNPTCIQICVKGCFCKSGLLRNKQGKCVEPCDC